MAPLKLGYCHEKNGKVNERHLKFYRDRSRFLGALVMEPFYIDLGLRENPFQLGIDNDDKIAGIRDIVDLLHRDGTKAIAHINHPGRMANAGIPGNYFWSSTATACENGGGQPLAMDGAMMEVAIGKIIQAAARAEKAGVDMIELQFGYGYLLSQFLSPAINQRNDSYGGSFENRMRFPLQVFKAVLSAIDIPVIARISADDLLPNGIKPGEAIAFSKELIQLGAVALHITAGSVCTSPAWFYQHMFVPKGKNWELAAGIKNAVDAPVFFHGRIHSASDISVLKDKYGASYFSLGRALVADENFVKKIIEGKNDEIRPCLACSEGCLGGVRSGLGLGCVVNPLVNSNLNDLVPAKTIKKIAVVGGGLAGMETAITLHLRGHKVVLYEKNELGGQFLLASLPPAKESLNEIIDYYKNTISRLNIRVIHQEANPEILNREGYDEVVMATGAVPVIPPIMGLKEFYWAEVLEKQKTPENKNVLVIGGGLIGIEVASKLVDHGNKVTIVEMVDEIARGLEMIERTLTLKKLRAKDTLIMTGTKVTEVRGRTVVVQDNTGTTRILDDFDMIVVATGMKNYRPFEYKDPVHYVGDANRVAKAQEAIHDACLLSANL